eukprot:g21434.t1
MDRLEIAQQKYDQIAPQPLQLDEQKSDEIEEWLRDYVVPLVADLQRNPAFRRHVNFGIERLAAETDTRERLQVVAVSDALVDCAAELERIGLQDEFRDLMTDRDLLQELNDRIYGVSSTASAQEDQNQGRDPRCIAAKMVEQPWFDLVMSLDFPYRADHLYVQTDDSSLDRAFDKFRPGIPVLGDGITRMLFARIDFWMHYLQGVWNQILMRIMQTSDDPHHEYETFFMTKHRLDNCVEELRATCLSGDDPRMRDACCALMQAYIAYHPRPQLPWLDMTADCYQAKAGILGLEFRRLHELIEFDQVDSKTIQESGRRQANIVVMGAIHKVLAALEDVAELYRQSLRLRSCCPSKKVKRTREDIRREQQALLEKNKGEIDAIVAEFHAKLPREKATAIGAVYARYSSRFQDSIADQIRTLFEAACEEGIFIPREHVFFDLAVRGWKDRRPGLTALRQAIEKKAFQVFLVFTTSRLFRRTYKALQFVEEELVERGIRGIFVKSNLDTSDDENWRTMFQLFAAMDEAMVRMYGSHVQAAHEGLFIRGMVCTSLSLGYTGEEVPGEFTKRKLPRRRIVVDPEAAKWIEKIFEWYVVDGKSLDEIPRELNDDPEAPAPNKSMTGLWTHKLVRNHLKNPRYRGYWSYGANETKWSSDKDYARQVPRDKPLRSGQFEELRIIDDDRWYRAQQMLAEERGNSGRKSKDGNGQARPRMLRGLFICPEHGRQLVVGGKNAHILFCPLCRAIKAEKRPLFTYLKRALALQLTCQKLCELIRPDDELVADIVSACQHEAAAAQKPDLTVLKRLRAQAQKLSSTIEFNRRNPGDTDEEQRRTQELLRELRRQQTDVLAQVTAHEAATNGAIVVPEPEEIVALLDELGELITAAASAETDEQMRTARRIIDELTGGRIDLYQMGERKKCGGWLQGRFTVDVVTVVIDKLTGVRLVGDDSNHFEVVIDYLAPKMIDEQADEAKRLWDQNLLNKQIAKKMGCTKSYVTKLLHHWFDSHGLPRPDGRRRRAHLVNKQETVPVYKQMAEQVVQLVEAGLSNLAIAKQLKTSDTTVAKSIAWWYQSRGLPVPTAADRRRKILARARSLFLDGMQIKDIAAETGYTARGLKLALTDYFTELGEDMPDGRICNRGSEFDEELMDRLLERCRRPLVYHARRYGLDPDDVLQELLMRLADDDWRRLREWQGNASLKTWLSTVIARICQNIARARRVEREKRVPMPLTPPVDEASRIETLRRALQLDHRVASIYEALNKLSEREAFVLLSRYYEERPTEEIAAALETTPNNVNQICYCEMTTTNTASNAMDVSLKTRFLDLTSRFVELELGDEEERAARAALCRPILDAVSAGIFRVVIMGEVKKGKSTFINAMLGMRDLLPVDTDIATSTVYKVVYGPEHRFTVFFEEPSDNSDSGRAPLAIPREEIPNYGTEYGNPGNEKQVSFIAIELNNPLLKEGISIVDTPGVGGLFRKHRDITFEYAPKADVVFFIVDSVESVISKDEVAFLQELRKHSPQIVFLQTKSDKAGQEQVVAWKDRNLEVLAAALETEAAAIPYFVVSAKLKQIADETRSMEDLTESGFAEFMRFLQTALVPNRDRVVLMRWIPLIQAAMLRDRVAVADRLNIARQAQADNRPQLEAYQAELKAAESEFSQWQSETWPTIQREYRNAVSQLDRTSMAELEDATLPENTIPPILQAVRAELQNPRQLLEREESLCAEHAARCNSSVNEVLSKYRREFQQIFQDATGRTIETLGSISDRLVMTGNHGSTELDLGNYRTMRETYMGAMFMQSLRHRMAAVGLGGLSLAVASGTILAGTAVLLAGAGSVALVATEIWSYVRGYRQSRRRQMGEALRSVEMAMNKTCQAAFRAGRRELGNLAAELKQAADDALFNFQRDLRASFEKRRAEIDKARLNPMSNFDYASLVNELERFVARISQLLRQGSITQPYAGDVERISLADDPPFTLAVVGQMRSGKSTLINAMIGDDKAVVGTRETTATVNWIRHGTGERTQRFRVAWNTVPAQSEELPLAEVTRWTGDSDLARKTRYLEFFSDADFLKRVQIVDTPGSRSVIEHHQDTLQAFLTAARRCEHETNYFGGAADCLVYVLPAVGRVSDADLLESFASQTRIPGSSPYNSVGVFHKWEAVIESETPWQDAQQKAETMARQLRSFVSDVLVVSGPLHRLATETPTDIWQRIVELLNSLSPVSLSRLLLHQKYFLTHPLNSKWPPDARRELLADTKLPWECFKVVLQFAAQRSLDSAGALQRAIGELAGVNRLMDLLHARFFSRAKAIRAATVLRKALLPCDEAIRKLRLRNDEITDRVLDAGDAEAELSAANVDAGATVRFIRTSVSELKRERSVHDILLRDLEISSRGVREPFLGLDADMRALQAVDEHPELFQAEQLTEIFSILGAYGHSLPERCGSFANWKSDPAEIGSRLSYWIGQYELSIGSRRRILERVVERLEEILITAFPGDAARQQILGDPNGAVRNFVHLLQRTEDVFRNGRWVNATDLTATFFHDLRDRIGRVLKGETLVAVVLPTKAVTEHGVRESLKRSAMLGGFTNVSTVDAPACIAQSATATQDLDAEAVVVADMGAGRTELCLVERKRGMFRVCPKVLAISAIGVAWIDDMVWDNLRKSPEEHPKTAGEADTVRRELAAARECFMGNGTGAGEATSPHALPVSPRVIERSLTQYYDEAFAGLPALVRETTGAGFANAPLVLAGEGSRLFGVESALRDRGWVGPILRFHPPGTMTVLGATLFAKTAKRTCPSPPTNADYLHSETEAGRIADERTAGHSGFRFSMTNNSDSERVGRELMEEVQKALRTLSELDRHREKMGDEAVQLAMDVVGDAKRRIGRNELYVSVVGEKKAGKSTFLNAILGGRLLSAAVRECTGTVTMIRSSDDIAFRATLENGRVESMANVFLDRREQLRRTLAKSQAQIRHYEEAAVRLPEQRAALTEKLTEATQTAGALRHQLEEATGQYEQHCRELGIRETELQEFEARLKIDEKSVPYSFRRLAVWYNPVRSIMQKMYIKKAEPGWTAHLENHKQLKSSKRDLTKFRKTVQDSLKRQRSIEQQLNNAEHQRANLDRDLARTEKRIAALPLRTKTCSARLERISVCQEQHESQRQEAFAEAIRQLTDLKKRGDEVRLLEIWVPTTCIPEGLVIIDTPGVNTDHKQNRERAWGTIRRDADGCIVLSDIGQVVSQSTQEFVREVRGYLPHIILVLTKVDKAIESATFDDDGAVEEIEEARRTGEQRFAAEVGRAPDDILSFAVSAERALNRDDPIAMQRFADDTATIAEILRNERAVIVATRCATTIVTVQQQISSALAAAEEAYTQQIALLESNRIPDPTSFCRAQMRTVDDDVAELSEEIVAMGLKIIDESYDALSVNYRREILSCTSGDHLKEYLGRLQSALPGHVQRVNHAIRKDLSGPTSAAMRQLEEPLLRALRERYQIVRNIAGSAERQVSSSSLGVRHALPEIHLKLSGLVQDFQNTKRGGVAGGAAAGAMAGSVIPGLGTLFGGLLGGLAGLFFGPRFDVVRQECADKFSAAMDQLKRTALAEFANNQPRIRQELRNALEKGLQNAVREFGLAVTRDSLLEDAFRVLVVGEFSRGKSTLINALLGAQVLPAKVAPCTAVITRLGFGEQKRAVLRYRDGGEESIDLARMPDELKRRITIIDQESNPIEYCDVQFPLPLLRSGVEIVDSPGLNESEVRTEITCKFFDRTDAIILVLNCEQAFSASERSFLENELRDRDLRDVFFLWNRFDAIRDSSEDLDDITQLSRERLESRVDGRSRVFFVSARDALRGRLQSDPSLLERSNLPQFERELEEFLATERGRVKLRGPIRIAENAIQEGLNKLIPHRENLIRQPVEELRRIFEEQRPELESAERKQERILRQIDSRHDAIRRDAISLIRSLVLEIEASVARAAATVDIGTWEAAANHAAVRQRVEQQISAQVSAKTQDWEGSVFRPAIEAAFAELERDLNDELQEFFDSLDKLDRDFGDIEADADASTALSQIVSSNSPTSSSLPTETTQTADGSRGSLLRGVGVTIAAGATLAVMHVPALIIGGVLAAFGIGGSFFRGQQRANEIREAAVDQICNELRAKQQQMEALISDKISATVARIGEGVKNRMAIRIDEVRGQVETVLRDKEQHEIQAADQLQLLENCRGNLETFKELLESAQSRLSETLNLV